MLSIIGAEWIDFNHSNLNPVVAGLVADWARHNDQRLAEMQAFSFGRKSYSSQASAVAFDHLSFKRNAEMVESRERLM